MNEAELLTFKDTRKDKAYFDKYIKSNNKWMNISALRLIFADISQNPEKSNNAAMIFCNKMENIISAIYIILNLFSYSMESHIMIYRHG